MVLLGGGGKRTTHPMTNQIQCKKPRSRHQGLCAWGAGKLTGVRGVCFWGGTTPSQVHAQRRPCAWGAGWEAKGAREGEKRMLLGERRGAREPPTSLARPDPINARSPVQAQAHRRGGGYCSPGLTESGKSQCKPKLMERGAGAGWLLGLCSWVLLQNGVQDKRETGESFPAYIRAAGRAWRQRRLGGVGGGSSSSKSRSGKSGPAPGGVCNPGARARPPPPP